MDKQQPHPTGEKVLEDLAYETTRGSMFPHPDGRQGVVGEKSPYELLPCGLVVRGELSFEEWEALGQSLERVNVNLPWWIGDWYNYGKGRYGERFSQALAVGKATGLDPQTIQTYGWVAAKWEFSTRIENLSFNHHRQLAGRTAEERQWWMNRAGRDGLSARELGEQVKKALRDRTHDPGSLEGRFRVVYADPPWEYNDSQGLGFGKAEEHYPTMAVEDICALPVKDHLLEDAVLFMWATAPLLPECLPVLTAWGFEYKTHMVWDKARHNVGHYLSNQHELLLIGVRGSCTPDRPVPAIPSVQRIERGGHSQKPEEFYAIVERLYDGPYLEMFARSQRHGWSVYGNQAGGNTRSTEAQMDEATGDVELRHLGS